MSDIGNRRSRVKKGVFMIFLPKKVTLEFYWPKIYFQELQKGILLPTTILWQPKKSCFWNWSIAALFFGFGVGLAFEHCDHPSMKDEP